MTGKPTRARKAPVRFDGLDTMPAARPLSDDFKALTDVEIERRANADPDAGSIPDGFWDRAEVTDPASDDTITLQLDPDVARWFRSQGTEFRARMNAVLRHYVEAQKKTG